MPSPPTPNPGPPDPFAITKPQALLAAALFIALLASTVFAAATVPREWYTPQPDPASPPTRPTTESANSDPLQPDPLAPTGLPSALGNPTIQHTDREPLGLIPYPTASNPNRAILKRQGTAFHTATWLVPTADVPAVLEHYTRQLAAQGMTTRGIQLPASETSPDLPPPTLFLPSNPNQTGRFFIRFHPADPPNTSLRLIYDQAAPASNPR
ncbi:MAG: hypothetical protein AAF750_04385 [Planctomycetota bacterium]